MAVLTEAMLRARVHEMDFAAMREYRVPEGTVVTPSARAWLLDRKVDLVIGERSAGGVAPRRPEPRPAQSALPAFTKPDHFDVIDGSTVATKPEHLTALRGNLLVAKDHPVIRFRGQLDALEAQIIVAQVAFRRLGLERGVTELGEVLACVKNILRAEVLEEPLGEWQLCGLPEQELRERSHHPMRYFGIPHFAASVDDGEAVALLNALRTRSREVELAAFDAFTAGGTAAPERGDIIQALNRLSSAFYLMMFKAKTKEYGS
jgi:ethanolamine utilization cobalamin adenosyltransferase